MTVAIDFSRYHKILDSMNTVCANGKVTKVAGFLTEAQGPAARLGSICDIYPRGNLSGI